MKSNGLCLLAWALLMAALAPNLQAQSPAEMYFTASDDAGGGVGVLHVDPARDAITDARMVVHRQACAEADKLAITDSGRHLGFAYKGDETQFAIVSLNEEDDTRFLELPEEPDEVQAVGESFLVAGDRGALWRIDSASGEIAARWSAKDSVDPPAWHLETFRVMPERDLLIATVQKDKSDGSRLGSRVIVIGLPELTQMHDLQLPRNRPELHYPRDVNLKEQGPNPEEIFVSERHDTLAVTADLYGAIVTMDLEPAVNEGRFERRRYQTTSLDESWGHTFPDRGVRITENDRDYLLITNAGPDHGAVMLDMASREIVARYETRAGLESLAYLSEPGLVIAAPAGKIKSRGSTGFESRDEPLDGLYLWETRPLRDGRQAEMRFIELPGEVRWVTPVPGEPRLAVLLMKVDDADRFVLFDLDDERIVDQRDAPGTVQRMIGKDTSR